jgi:hypothetical protein
MTAPASTQTVTARQTSGTTATANGARLVHQAQVLIQAGNYQAALAPLRQAVQLLQGRGTTDEGNANYELTSRPPNSEAATASSPCSSAEVSGSDVQSRGRIRLEAMTATQRAPLTSVSCAAEASGSQCGADAASMRLRMLRYAGAEARIPSRTIPHPREAIGVPRLGVPGSASEKPAKKRRLRVDRGPDGRGQGADQGRANHSGLRAEGNKG